MSATELLTLAIAGLGAIAAAWAAPRRPLLCLGILFVLASLSRLTVETPVGGMRPEQPAIAATTLVLLVSGRWRAVLGVPRWVPIAAAGLVGYLVVLALSSALMAPDPVASLRVVVWWGLSIVGGVVAFVLARQAAQDPGLPFAVGAATKAVTGIVVAAMFLAFGPAFDFGIQGVNSTLPRVHAFTWETNLYASLLAMCLPFALESARTGVRGGWALLALVAIGLPLGVTRGAYIGLAAGIATYWGIWAWRRRDDPGVRMRTLARPAAGLAVALAVGLLAADILLPNAVERILGPGGGPSASQPPGSGAPTPAPGETPSPTPQPLPSLGPGSDTLDFRMRRLPLAFADLRGSPLIGLGAASFGQRHVDPTRPGEQDHIAVLAVALPYESGLLGTAALGVALLALVIGLWRSSANAAFLGSSAAFLGSIATVLVAYQATNALHFAHNWLIFGAAAALAVRGSQPAPTRR